MKIRKVAALVAAVVITHSAQAQWKKGYEQNDWSVSYGFSSCITMVDALGDVEMSDPRLGNIETDNRESIGAFTAQFMHRKGRKVSFGGAIAFQITNEDCNVVDRKSGGLMKDDVTTGASVTSYKHGELTNYYASIMPQLRFNWKETKNVLIYSKLGLGMTFIFDSYSAESTDGTTGVLNVSADATSEKQHYFAYQLSPIGIIVGRKACGFAEVGFGTQGIAQVGFMYRF